MASQKLRIELNFADFRSSLEKKVFGSLKLNKFQWSHDQMERVETTIDATSFVGHVGESLSSFCNNSLFSDVLIRIGANAYGK